MGFPRHCLMKITEMCISFYYIYIIFIRGKEKVRWAGEFWCGWGCCGIGFDMLRCQFDLKA